MFQTPNVIIEKCLYNVYLCFSPVAMPELIFPLFNVKKE